MSFWILDFINNLIEAAMKKINLELDVMMAKGKMSLQELADKVGITNVNLSKIKNNKVNAIRFSTLEGICDALDCEPGDILKLSE